MLKCLDCVYPDHVAALQFVDALTLVKETRECVVPQADVAEDAAAAAPGVLSSSPPLPPRAVPCRYWLNYVGAQLFRRAHAQLKFCFGPGSTKPEAAKMFMAACVKRLVQ